MDSIFYEDLEQGAVFRSSSRTLTEADFLGFAQISGDCHPIHVDAAYAAQTEFGQRIAHGPFGIALAVGLFCQFPEFQETAIAMIDFREWVFRMPMFIGDEIWLRMTVGEKYLTRSKRGVVVRHFELMRADGTVPQRGSSAMLIRHRDPPSSPKVLAA
jgi:acyl dehydratase